MKNTALDAFLRLLQQKNNLISAFFNNNMDREERIEKLELLLTFFSPGYEETVYEAMKKRSCGEKGNILENLMQLYPLSRSLILHILKNMEQSEDFLVRGLDTSEQVCRQVRAILNEIRSASGQDKLTKRFEVYDREMKELNSKIEKLQEDIAQDIKYRDEKTKLEQEYERLNKEANQENRNAVIKELELKISKLEKEKKDFDREYKSKQQYMKKIRDEFVKEKNRLTNKDEQRLIRELMKKFPKDEGGDDV